MAPHPALAARVVADAHREQDAIAAAAMDAIVTAIAPYAAATDPAVLVDLADHCTAHMRAFLDSLEPGAPTIETNLDFVTASIERRFRQGIPLDAVLHAFRIGHQVMWEALVDIAGRHPGGAEVAVALVAPSMRYVDVVSTCVADVYLREQQHAMADADRRRRDALELLLAEDPRAIEAARSAGITLDPEVAHVVLAGTVAGGDTGLSDLGQRITSAFGAAAVLVVVRHDTVTALLACAPERATATANTIAAALAGARLGIGLPATLDALGRADAEAQAALDLAGPPGAVVALGDLPALDYMLARADDTARRLVPSAVAQLAGSPAGTDRALLDTLHAYVANGLNVQRTASALPAHPNTVHHRLRRLAGRTGYDLRDARDLMRLMAELRLADVTR